MTASQPDRPGAAQPPDDPEALRREIDTLRQDLGDTVEALAAKVDVKAQARDKVEQLKAQARERAQTLTASARDTTVQMRDNAKQTAASASTRAKDVARRSGPAPAVVAGAIVLTVVLLVWRRKRSRR
jgi:CHASE3 domain sensor protein